VAIATGLFTFRPVRVGAIIIVLPVEILGVHNKGVAIPGDVERLGKAGRLGRPPRTDIVIDPLASSPFQCVALEIEGSAPEGQEFDAQTNRCATPRSEKR
jgi:hypothetical protein